MKKPSSLLEGSIWLFIGLFILCMVGLSFFPKIEDLLAKPEPDGRLKAILSSPDAFEMKTVTVEGYEECRFEGDTVWVSRSAWQRGDSEQALCLAIDRSDKVWPKFNEYANRKIRMTGTFSHPPTGHKNFRPCYLSNISSIELLEK